MSPYEVSDAAVERRELKIFLLMSKIVQCIHRLHTQSGGQHNILVHELHIMTYLEIVS